MPRGGKRPGSGRKPGAVNQTNRNLAEWVMQSGLAPLEVMINAMRGALECGDEKSAVTYATAAAPYVHARIQSVELKNPNGEEFKTITRVIFEGVAVGTARSDT